MDAADQTDPAPNDEDLSAADEPRGLTLDGVTLDLDEVDAALVRLDAGTYGRCAVCDATIDDAVLAARPTAAACGTHEGTD